MTRKSNRRIALLALLAAICFLFPQPLPFAPLQDAKGAAAPVDSPLAGLKLGSTSKDSYDDYIRQYEGATA